LGFDDDIKRVSDDEATPAHGGEGGGGGDVGPSCAGFEGGSDLLGSSGAIPFEEEEYTPPLIRSHIGAGSSGFNTTRFYQYTDDHFSRLNLWLDAIDEGE